MSTNKFAVYTERDLITIVDGLSNETLKFTIPELKELQSELINRRIDGQQVSTVSNLIMKQMSDAPDKTEDKKKYTKRGAAIEQAEKENIFLKEPEVKDEKEPEAKAAPIIEEKPEIKDFEEEAAPKKKKEKFLYIDEEEYEDDYYDEAEERFPVLGFLTAFYKIIGWLGVIAVIGSGVTVSLMLEFTKSIMILTIAGCIVIAAMFILIMTAMSEKIALELEKEKHLRRIRDLLRRNEK